MQKVLVSLLYLVFWLSNTFVMANEIKIEVLTFRIREIRSNKDDDSSFKNLENINGKKFTAVFGSYLLYIKSGLEKNEYQKKALTAVSKKVVKTEEGDSIISGTLKSGGYGYESDIYNLSSNEIRITKGLDDAEIIPFYYLCYIPKENNIGVIMLQRFGVNGINTVFTHSLHKYIKENLPGHIIDFGSFVSKELAKAFTSQAAIKEIILTRYDLPKDLSDKYGLKNFNPKNFSIEFRLKAKQGAVFGNLRVNNFLNNPNAKFFETKMVKDMGFDSNNHTISVVSKLNGNTRTIDLSDTGNIKPYYDIHAQVELEPSFHPKFESINQVAKDLLNELIGEILDTK
jgi:hypothetical protein